MEMRVPIIGVTGRASAGKDTVCNYIVRQRRSAVKIACADPLKEVCQKIFGTAFDVSDKIFYGTQEEKEAPIEAIPGWTGRKILQFIGTEGFRHVHSEVWSRYMIGRALQLIESNTAKLVLVSDIRFTSEEKVIRDAGGIIVRVKRPEADSVEATHPSELGVLDIKEDYVIDNQGRELYLLEKLIEEFLCQLNF